MVQVKCMGCGALLWANNATVKGHCGPCMDAIVKARAEREKKTTKIDAASWFYGQSFNGRR